MNKKAVIVLLVLAMSLVAFASTTEEVKVTLNNLISIKVNGQVYIPKDTDGSSLAPISYKGRTYLPVRALAEALSVPVNYDPATNTVLIGTDKTAATNKTKLVDLYSFTSLHGNDFLQLQREKSKLTMFGYTSTSGITSDRVTTSSEGQAFKLDGKYKTLKFKLGYTGENDIVILTIKNLDAEGIDYENLDSYGNALSLSDKGVSIFTSTLTKSTTFKEVEIDVTGIKTLGISIDKINGAPETKYNLLIADPALE